MANMAAEKTFPVTHSDAEWQKILTPEQYQVLRHHATERPGSCALNYEKRAGTFSCAGCGQELFKSGRKFESGTGWPSFNDPLPGAVAADPEIAETLITHRFPLDDAAEAVRVAGDRAAGAIKVSLHP